ncbi:MAG TPA: hypothetical protein VH475_28920 [Tepidisphaeraceae bacterium]|jgi:hypothetical protein
MMRLPGTLPTNRILHPALEMIATMAIMSLGIGCTMPGKCPGALDPDDTRRHVS